MPNYYLSVLYKHIIQVENKNVGGAQTYHCPPPPNQKCPPPPPPPRFLRQFQIAKRIVFGFLGDFFLSTANVIHGK